MNHDIRNSHDTVSPLEEDYLTCLGFLSDVQELSVSTSTAVELAADSSNFRWGLGDL